MIRAKVSEKEMKDALTELREEMERRISEKGSGAFASTHEILGVVIEEVWELVEAVKRNDSEDACSELMDIAVACVFGVASFTKRR